MTAVDTALPKMMVRKRNGNLEAVNLDKIVNSINKHSVGLRVDPMLIATKVIASLSDGATTADLDDLAIRLAATMMADEPDYSKLAARILATVIEKEVGGEGISSFEDSVMLAHELGLVNDRTAAMVAVDSLEFDVFMDSSFMDAPRDWLFEFFGLRTLYDRYLLRHPVTRKVIETPQMFFMRVAVGLSETTKDAIGLYDLMSSLSYMPSSPTLFNSGTNHEQMSSCYLLDSPQDSLTDIYDTYSEAAQLSKFAGGIGVSWSRIRSEGSLIKGTNGLSNGVVPWLKILDASVGAVNQGGRRKGAACVYLETWHADIESFLELRDNTGSQERRAHNINLANFVPDLFMERVRDDKNWSLFDPKDAPELVDLYGDEFVDVYQYLEACGLAKKTVKARTLYQRMMKTLAETGNGWMVFKDAANEKSNQTGKPGNVVHLSNLCTEIMEVTSNEETAVCNLGSINLGAFVNDRSEYDSSNPNPFKFDFGKLGETVRFVVPFLDRVIDRNFYPSDKAAASNPKWRPIGLGVMGLADVFFKLGIAFDSEEARQMSQAIQAHIYYHALNASVDLAARYGQFPAFPESRMADGKLSFDLWPTSSVILPGSWPDAPLLDWKTLRKRIELVGVRNSLLIAIAPTSTIASICGCYECIEPQTANLFKRETLSGEFLQINTYLVRELQERGLWTPEVRDGIKSGQGSVQHLDLPEELKHRYRTVWEMSQKALIEMAADRGPFIDQSQSLNLFIEDPTISKLSSMYLYAWQKGLKSTYYLRSRPATRIASATAKQQVAERAIALMSDGTIKDVSYKAQIIESRDVDLIADSMTEAGYQAYWAAARQHSLENPEECEACQ